MALADAANDEGRCWPRVRTVAVKCGVSSRTVQRVLREFETTGLVTVTRRFVPGRGQTSNSYWLGTEHPHDKLTPQTKCHPRDDVQDTTPVTQRCRPGCDTDTSYQEPKQNQKHESPLQPSDGQNHTPTIPRFPRNLSHAELGEIRELLANVPIIDAQVLLDELTGVMADRHTIKTSPMRWFRAVLKRYRAGTFVPNVAIDVARNRERHDEGSRSYPKAHRQRASAEVASRYLADIQKIVGEGS
jgi:hypothetical protein